MCTILLKLNYLDKTLHTPTHSIRFSRLTPAQMCQCCLGVCVKQSGGSACYGRTTEGFVGLSVHTACHRAPAVSLSVFLLITHHSFRGKAPHKLQRIVPCRSACHHTAPHFRVRLIVDREQNWGPQEGPMHTDTHMRTHTTLSALTHID